jgi:hypothetical protein
MMLEPEKRITRALLLNLPSLALLHRRGYLLLLPPGELAE